MRYQYISVTCPSSSAGAQVSAQQADRNTGLLDGSWLLEAHSCDGLKGHERKQLKKNLRANQLRRESRHQLIGGSVV